MPTSIEDGCDWQNPTSPTFDDPKTVEALDWYAKLIHLYHVAPTPEQARLTFGGDDQSCFARGVMAGKAGMWTGVHSNQGGQGWWQPWRFNWGMVTLPRDAQAVTSVRVEALVVSSQAQHPEACWEWISFISHQMPPDYVPARRSLLESDAYERQVGAEVAAVDRAALQSLVLFSRSDSASELAEAWQVLQKAVREVYDGSASAAEALTRAQEEGGE